MISDKDRSQLLRMAGNIACGIYTVHGTEWTAYQIASESAFLAFASMQEVDKLIERNKEKPNA